jgi:hypothetical protein
MAPVISIRDSRNRQPVYPVDLTARETISRIRRPLQLKLVYINVDERQHNAALTVLNKLKEA